MARDGSTGVPLLLGCPRDYHRRGETGSAVIRNLRLNKILGYRPVACLDDDPGSTASVKEFPSSAPCWMRHRWPGD